MKKINLSPWAMPGIKQELMPNEKLTPELIRREVLLHLGITLEQVQSKYRKTEIVYCRQMIQYMLRHLTLMSLKSIGEFVKPDDPLDHTTVMYSNRTIQDLFDTSPVTRSDVFAIRNRIWQCTQLEPETMEDAALLSIQTKPSNDYVGPISKSAHQS